MSTLTDLPPLSQRWAAYFKERFKIGLNLFATVMMVATAGSAASSQVGAKIGLWSQPRLYLMAAVFFLVFLHLRVFDEHKDYAVDSVRFPERVLSKGWVTLAQLRRIAEVAIPLEIVLAYGVGMPFLWATVGVIAYSFLMFKEFFVADWLKARMVLYGVSHMAIIPLIVLAALVGFEGAIPEPYDPLHPSLLMLAGVYFCFLYSLEIARKIRPPELEKPDVDTYSKLLGVRVAIHAVLFCQFAALGVLAASGLAVSQGAWISIAIAEALTAALFLAAARKPQAKTLGKLDNVGALPFLVMQIALIVSWS